MSHHIGDGVRLTCTFTDASGAPADPTQVACAVRKPSGLLITPPPVRSSTGAYYADIVPDSAGVWRYRWAATGAEIAVDEGVFDVLKRKA